jgi:DnaJ-class molecular chaperone
MKIENCYEMLEISTNFSNEELEQAYELKIGKYNNLPFLTDVMKHEVKQIKIAYYILSNDKLKNNYNKTILNNNNKILNNSDSQKLDNNYILNRLFQFS